MMIKHQVDEMVHRLNDILIKRLVDEIACWLNSDLIWSNGALMKCHVAEMTKHQFFFIC
jgi:hypothetical protein